MIRLVFILFISVLFLHAVGNDEILSRAVAHTKSGDKSQIFKAYNDYKNLYVRSMMAENDTLKATSLKGIIECGTFLNIDISKYKQELVKLNPKHQTSLPSAAPQPIFHKENNKIAIKATSKLTNAKFEEETLVLTFDKELDANQISYSPLYDAKTKQNRYVFDFSNAMLTKSLDLRKTGINKIRLSQYKGDALRIILEDSKQLTMNYKIESNKVLIVIGSDAIKKVPEKAVTPSRLDKNKVIVLDAGHGGDDPGAIGHKGYREKAVVFQIAKELRNILKARGYKVHMTREGDKFVKLSERTKFANNKNADIFVSVHANAVEKSSAERVNGIECYFLSKSRSDRAKKVAALENSADMSDMNFYGKDSFLSTINSHNIVASNKLAIDLQGGMLSTLRKNYSDVMDAGVREGPFWILVGAQMPSVLVEVGFISHPKEGARLVSTEYQKSLAQGIADGIERYFANN